MKRIEDIGKRALKTFLQAFLGALVIMLPNNDFSQEGVWKSVIIGAVASGLSATMNYINNLLNDKEVKEVATNVVIEEDLEIVLSEESDQELSNGKGVEE